MTSRTHDQHATHGTVQHGADHAGSPRGERGHVADHAPPAMGGGTNAMAASATLHCLTGCASAKSWG